VRAVVALCGKRLNTLDDEFAPQLAAARGAVLAACPSLQPELDAYLAHSKVLAMHDARPQVIGHEAAAVACLDEESQGQLKSASAEGRTDIVADLLAKAFSMLSAKGHEAAAVACLDEKSQGQLKSARAEGRTDIVADLLAKAFSLLGAKGHEAAAVACLDEKSQAQLALVLAQNQPGEVQRLRKQARTALSDKGAAACLPPESQAQLALALAQGRADVVADLLAKGRSLRGALQPLNRKAPGCKVTVTELTPNGREGECILKANRLEKTRRFQIACEANGGVFGYERFVLYVSDAKSGAEADNLGNIIKLPPFIIAKDGRRFECKFTEFIAMANVASSAAGVDLAEAVVP
jgi:hypothetical protein